MSGKNYELLYFNIPGRGETARLVFHYLAKEFTDRTVEFSEWPTLKQDVSKVPCGFMPVLTLPSGEKLVQTTAILRYLGNEFGLHGSNNVERARVDAVLDFNKELFDGTVNTFMKTKDPTEQGKLAEALDKSVHQAFTYFENVLKENKSGPFFLGEKLTVADLYFYETATKVNSGLKDKKYFEKYLLLKNLFEKTGTASPTLQAYLEKRYK